MCGRDRPYGWLQWGMVNLNKVQYIPWIMGLTTTFGPDAITTRFAPKCGISREVGYGRGHNIV